MSRVRGWGRRTGSTVEATGPRKEQVEGKENDRLLRDRRRSLYSDIGSGMAKWKGEGEEGRWEMGKRTEVRAKKMSIRRKKE